MPWHHSSVWSVVPGTNRDNDREVDVSTTGSVDSSGGVSLTATLTNGGSPRATITFMGTITPDSGSSQTIEGTYTATGPSVTTADGTETGTFSMTHN